MFINYKLIFSIKNYKHYLYNSVLVPVFLSTRNVTVNETDKNPCPYRA